MFVLCVRAGAGRLEGSSAGTRIICGNEDRPGRRPAWHCTRRSRAAPITQHRRLELLGQVLTDDHGPLRSRVAACLMLLFAQPATRIVRLTIDDITRAADGGVFIRFGEPPTLVPESFATLLLQTTAQRDNLQTATNPVPAGCFPDAEAASRCTPAPSVNSFVISASLPWPAGPPRCANSSCRPCPRRHPGTGLPPQHHHPGRDRGRNAVEPLRRRRPPPAVINLSGRWCRSGSRRWWG